LVANAGAFAMSKPYQIIGTIKRDYVLIIGDHASNHVPSHIDLGISEALLEQHIAVDIGVFEVANGLSQQFGFAGFLGGQSRLVVDLNRNRDDLLAIPIASDGIEIIGNALNSDQREERLATYFDPYHSELEHILDAHRPALILSLHSFTPQLESDPGQQRPWDIGVLYNEYDTASRWAIQELADAGLLVGDQLPYSGKLLNATMNRHAEGNEIPYIGVEMRQDVVSDPIGVDRFVQILGSVCNNIMKRLADQ
jgi:predicted N-formylglutamate amidohydrolase